MRTAQLPYRTAVGLTFDSGDFRADMDATVELADWDGFEERRHAARARGRLRGIGIANYVEAPVGAPRERVVLTVRPERVVEIATGTQSTGQGHETTFAQVAAELLDVPLETVRLVQGDTGAVNGGGTHSNRSMRIVGTLLVQTCTELRERAGPGDLFALAARSGAPLVAEADFAGRIPSHPTGCAICELEIDPATGERDDRTLLAGRRRRPSDQPADRPRSSARRHRDGHRPGALRGAAVDRDAGQVSGGTFMEYAVPHAFQVPHYDVGLLEHPTAGNPLRVKGGGEGGVTPAPAAIVNAICDALRDYGVDHIDTPATPEKIWRAILAARQIEEVPA